MTKRIILVFILLTLLVFLDAYVFLGFDALFANGLPLAGNAIYWMVSLSVIFASLAVYWHSRSPFHSKYLNPHLLLTGILMIVLGKLFFMLSLVTDDIRRVAVWLWEHGAGPSGGKSIEPELASRSPLMPKVGLVAAAIPAGALTYGVTLGAHDYKVTRKSIYIDGLAPSLEGVRIGHFSDLHAGSLFSRKGVAKGVFKLMNEHPDMVFFTGDLVNASAHEVDDFKDLMAMVSAPMGVYSILGNHDYGTYRKWRSSKEKKENFEEVKGLHHEFGWHLLLNDHEVIEIGDARIGIIGVENWGKAERMPKRGDLLKATKNLPDVDLKVLLSHDPSHWLQKVVHHHDDIAITFAGHTHGMQFGVHTKKFKWSPVRYIHRHWSGLYQNNGQYLYVNRGFGHHGFPGRIGMPPELTILTLKNKRHDQ